MHQFGAFLLFIAPILLYLLIDDVYDLFSQGLWLHDFKVLTVHKNLASQFTIRLNR